MNTNKLVQEIRDNKEKLDNELRSSNSYIYQTKEILEKVRKNNRIDKSLKNELENTIVSLNESYDNLDKLLKF